MRDFDLLFKRWEIATAYMWEYMVSDSFVAPQVRDFLIAQLQARADQLLIEIWQSVREERHALPLL